MFSGANSQYIQKFPTASLAQLVEHALRKRMVTGSIPVGGSLLHLTLGIELLHGCLRHGAPRAAAAIVSSFTLGNWF
jgi:hypothetical protein